MTYLLLQWLPMTIMCQCLKILTKNLGMILQAPAHLMFSFTWPSSTCSSFAATCHGSASPRVDTSCYQRHGWYFFCQNIERFRRSNFDVHGAIETDQIWILLYQYAWVLYPCYCDYYNYCHFCHYYNFLIFLKKMLLHIHSCFGWEHDVPGLAVKHAYVC